MTISSLTWLLVVADANTPPENQQYAGRLLGLTSDQIGQLGSGPDNPGNVLGVRGYPRFNPATKQEEYLMIPDLDISMQEWLAALPTGLGWPNKDAEAAFTSIALALIRDKGIPTPEVKQALQTLYDASVYNGVAIASAGGDPIPDRTTAPQVVQSATPLDISTLTAKPTSP